MSRPLATPQVEAEAERRTLVALVGRVAIGDAEALRPLYDLTSGRIYALLRRMLPTQAVAEEVLQDVYVTVWRSAARFDASRGISPMSWLVTIARNKAVDWSRAERSARGAEPIDGLDVSDPAPSVLSRLEETESHRRLAACLDGLEGEARERVRAAFFGGLTYEELARRERVPVGTMKSWMRRSLLNLRACMGGP